MNVKFKRLTLAALFALLAVAQAQSEDQAYEDRTQPDNSAVNARDESGRTRTADKQTHGTRSDVEITRLIRRELTKDDRLSTYAKNVKIVTLNGNVELRGPVESEAERGSIERHAAKIVDRARIRNQLEVKSQAAE